MTAPASSANTTPHPTNRPPVPVTPPVCPLSSGPPAVCAQWQDHRDKKTDRPWATAAPTRKNPYPDVKSQKSFEKGLLEKTAKQTGDIILYDNRIVLYKMESDVMMYVVGGADENEVLLYNVILALRDSLHLLFKYAPSSILHSRRGHTHTDPPNPGNP